MMNPFPLCRHLHIVQGGNGDLRELFLSDGKLVTRIVGFKCIGAIQQEWGQRRFVWHATTIHDHNLCDPGTNCSSSYCGPGDVSGECM